MDWREFRRWYDRPDLRQSTIDGHMNTAALLLEAVGGRLDWCTLAKSDINNIGKSLFHRGLRKSTVAKHMRYLHAIIEHAKKMGLVKDNVADGVVIKLPLTPKRWEHVTTQQTLDALAKCTDPGVRCSIALCRWAGCRYNEMMRMRPDQVDLARRVLLIEPTPDSRGRLEEGTKGKFREVPICPELHAVLSADMASPLVCGPLLRRARENALAKVRTWPGQPWHTLRKACGSDWADKVPINVVAEWMGHSVLVASRYYLKPQAAHYAAVTGL